MTDCLLINSLLFIVSYPSFLPQQSFPGQMILNPLSHGYHNDTTTLAMSPESVSTYECL